MIVGKITHQPAGFNIVKAVTISIALECRYPYCQALQYKYFA